MNLVDLSVRSQGEIIRGAEVVGRAKALRRESRSLRLESEQLRFEHRRLRESVRQRREEAGARAKSQLYVPSPWSSLPWLSLAESFDDVLLLLP